MKALTEDKRVTPDSLLTAAEATRQCASGRIDPRRRVSLGQYLTPASVASFMAGMVECRKPAIRVLDPGAGSGSLSAAFVAAMCRRSPRPRSIALTAYEIDPLLVGYLQETLKLCEAACREAGVRLEARVIEEDFLEVGANTLARDIFAPTEKGRFDCAILNPPYRKIRAESPERRHLRSVGLETTNLYAGFLALAARLLAPAGEMVAITPRSFCNGPYFEPFRRFFLRDMRFRRVHVFDARDRAFADDEVLQENIVFRAVRTRETDGDVVVSASAGPTGGGVRTRTTPHSELVRPRERHAFIHIVPDAGGDTVRRRIADLGAGLSELGLNVSTGRVVGFRAKELLRTTPGRDTTPLIYPCHLRNGFVEWPNPDGRKPNALVLGPQAEGLLVPEGYYVLTKRFTSKEEPRRVVAAVYDPARVAGGRVGFENHVNYFHADGRGLPVTLAKGLAAFLNSTLVDVYFRQFSGHTQVNATDLRSLRYPKTDRLVALGRRIGRVYPPQGELDRLVGDVVFRE